MTVKVTYFGDGGQLVEVSAAGADYEAAKSAALAKIPEGFSVHAYWQVFGS